MALQGEHTAVLPVPSMAATYPVATHFHSVGGHYENNWANGDDDYRTRIKTLAGRISGSNQNRWAGRSDIFEWIDGDLAPRVAAVNAEFDQRYGWGNAQLSPVRSERPGQGTAVGALQADDAAANGQVVRRLDVAEKDGQRADLTGAGGSMHAD